MSHHETPAADATASAAHLAQPAQIDAAGSAVLGHQTDPERAAGGHTAGCAVVTDEMVQAHREAEEAAWRTMRTAEEATRAGLAAALAIQPYLSTGCLHGQHGYCQATEGHAGPKTPATCKFCAAACVCHCHREATL